MTQPQYSPDGQWWWDGTQWIPAYGYAAAPCTGYPAYPAPPASNHDGKAIGSLIAALVGGCGVGSLVAVVLGHLSRSEARREGREPSGMALAGLIIGYVGLALAAAVLAVFVIGFSLSTSFDTGYVDGQLDAGPAAEALHDAADAEEGFRVDHGVYASTIAGLYPYGYVDRDGVTVAVRWVSGLRYCLQASSAEQTLYLSSEESAPTAFPCL